ncbi:DNA recombination and repair protein RecF [Halalkalibacter akibai JCM 9157]|uniref:DNA recombination and repair protein RecF n=1 Tax=Halalkalibacter akibai (strain ATCC 43226 / DSM 21942 / CIP 109018 / JCM 9157 / 1139) TaxID=1236973 RepID=W4QQN5_HALA3|nr:DNA recombination and repair protein RecF [Halalkalibacter akibai JCM 9157]
MKLKQLTLRQFRNYQNVELAFDQQVNVFLGENAQGKTNIIEAIYVLALAKSHRTSKDKELIGWNHDFAKIQGKIEKKSSLLELELILSTKGKKGKVNGLEQKKLSEYIGAATWSCLLQKI